MEGRRREGGLGGLASELDVEFLERGVSEMGAREEDVVDLDSDTEDSVGVFEVLVSVVGFVYFGSSFSSVIFAFSSSFLLTEEEVEEVPCNEEALAKGGLAGDLVRIAR